MISDYFYLSLKSLRHRGTRSLLTMLGIFIGIAAVVSLISLGQGLQEAITGQISGLSTDTIIIQNSGTGYGPPGSTVVDKLNNHDINVISSVPEVEEIIPRLIRMVKLEYNKETTFRYVGSLPLDQIQINIIYSSTDIKIDTGKLLKPQDKGKVLLGNNFEDKERFGKAIKVGDTLKIQDKDFEVAGFLKKSNSIQMNGIILMLEEDLENILNINNEIDLILVKVSDGKNIEEIAKNIEEKLRKDRKEKPGEEDFSVQTPLQAISSVNTILNMVNIVVAGIAIISLIVGGIGIMNTMYTSVLERTREIGTMKAIGAKNSDILLIFLIESGLLGLVGGIIGSIIGLGFAFAVSLIANSALGATILNVSISYPLVAAAIGFSFLMGIFSGLLPAMQAGKLKPVEAIRR